MGLPLASLFGRGGPSRAPGHRFFIFFLLRAFNYTRGLFFRPFSVFYLSLVLYAAEGVELNCRLIIILIIRALKKNAKGGEKKGRA